MKKWNHSRNTNVFCPLQLDGIRAQIYDSFILLWDASGFPPADCTGDSNSASVGMSGKGTPFWLVQRLCASLAFTVSGEGISKSQKKVLVCFQYSCLGDGGNWAAVCLAQSLGGLFCCGVAQGWTKAVNLSYKEHHLTLPVPIQTLIWWLESQGVISRTCSSFKIPTLGAK